MGTSPSVFRKTNLWCVGLLTYNFTPTSLAGRYSSACFEYFVSRGQIAWPGPIDVPLFEFARSARGADLLLEIESFLPFFAMVDESSGYFVVVTISISFSLLLLSCTVTRFSVHAPLRPLSRLSNLRRVPRAQTFLCLECQLTWQSAWGQLSPIFHRLKYYKQDINRL